MTKAELSELIRSAMNSDNAPAIKVIPDGKTALPVGAGLTSSGVDELLRHCRCGCDGDYTEHSMRLGERGLLGD